MSDFNFTGCRYAPNLYHQHIACRKLRSMFDKEWRRFYRMSYFDSYNFISYYCDCTPYATKTCTREYLRGY